MLKVVLDTGIFVSSLLVKKGVPAQVLNAWRARRFILVCSAEIISEIRSTMEYPRIRRKYVISDDEIANLIALIERDALLVPGASDVADAQLRDPKDVFVLAAAADAGAELLVTGDADLLVLRAYRGCAMVKPRDFLQRLEESPDELGGESPCQLHNFWDVDE